MGRYSGTVTPDNSVTLTNKTINRPDNTLTNLGIVNADVGAGAAIDGSKLQTLSVGANAGVIPSTGIADAHVAPNAAIALSKIANISIPLMCAIPGGHTHSSNSLMYFAFGGNTYGGSEAVVQLRIPAGTIKRLRFYCSTNTINGDTVITLRKNTADTALTATVTASSGATTVTDDVNTVSVALNDLVDLTVSSAGNSGSMVINMMQVDFIPS